MGGLEVFRANDFRVVRILAELASHREHIEPHLRILHDIAISVSDTHRMEKWQRPIASTDHVQEQIELSCLHKHFRLGDGQQPSYGVRHRYKIPVHEQPAGPSLSLIHI